MRVSNYGAVIHACIPRLVPAGVESLPLGPPRPAGGRLGRRSGHGGAGRIHPRRPLAHGRLVPPPTARCRRQEPPFEKILFHRPTEDWSKTGYLEGQLFNIAPPEPGRDVLAYATLIVSEENVEICTIAIAYNAYPSFNKWKSERAAATKLPRNYGEAKHQHYVKDGSRNLRQNVTRRELDRIRSRLHNVLWKGRLRNQAIVIPSKSFLRAATAKSLRTRSPGLAIST